LFLGFLPIDLTSSTFTCQHSIPSFDPSPPSIQSLISSTLDLDLTSSTTLQSQLLISISEYQVSSFSYLFSSVLNTDLDCSFKLWILLFILALGSISRNFFTPHLLCSSSP
jgi:hypothetical protein